LTDPTITDLYLAWRQAKTALFYERATVGLFDLGRFEDDLEVRLPRLQDKMAGGRWFDGLDIGDVWVVPKRIEEPKKEPDVICVGTSPGGRRQTLDVQTRLTPSAEYAIAEVLYLWRFGPTLDGILSKNSVGYRLEIRRGQIDRGRNNIFEFWPKRYQEFRSVPLDDALIVLRERQRAVTIVSADVAAFYPSVSPAFLLNPAFLNELERAGMDDLVEYRRATTSLIQAIERFQGRAGECLGIPISTGIPIGGLTSRLIANLVLKPLDEYIERRPGLVAYRRYVDDVVIVAENVTNASKRATLAQLLPIVDDANEDTFTIDTTLMNRSGCDLQLQNQKIRVYHLVDEPGAEFLSAVKADFDRLVSRSEAFIDSATLRGDGVSHLIRATEERASPLRVLRNADRTRLERFALSISLKTLDLASTLLSRGEAGRVSRRVMSRVLTVLRSDDNWVEHLDTSRRLLRLAIASDDLESIQDLLRYFQMTTGTSEILQERVETVRYRGVVLETSAARALSSLVVYLLRRQVEAAASGLPPDASIEGIMRWLVGPQMGQWGLENADDLVERARLLGRADLRARDREDDQFSEAWSVKEEGTPAPAWMEGVLPDLRERFESVRVFRDACRHRHDQAWDIPLARLCLATRPPRYFDVSRRLLSDVEMGERGIPSDIFERVIRTVNALRGTQYTDPMGTVETGDRFTIYIPWHAADDDDKPRWTGSTPPLLVLGNLVTQDSAWKVMMRSEPNDHGEGSEMTATRLIGLETVISRAKAVSRAPGLSGRARRPTLLVLPELSVPRRWFRRLAHHIVRNLGLGAVMGLEYLHHRSKPYVLNQAYAVIPGPFQAVLTWPWTKRMPADEEGKQLAKYGLGFMPIPVRHGRVVIKTDWGRFTTLICSELIETRRVADLFARAELVLCPAWNTDTASYDHLVQSVGFQLHAIVAIANNGHYSDCRAWAPYQERWKRDLCRLIERDVNDIVHVKLPLRSLIAFHKGASSEKADTSPEDCIKAGCEPKKPEWKPLPPGWPSPRRRR